MDLSSHVFVHSSVDSHVCPDQRLNLQPWFSGMMLQPTELPGQGRKPVLFCFLINPVFPTLLKIPEGPLE